MEKKKTLSHDELKRYLDDKISQCANTMSKATKEAERSFMELVDDDLLDDAYESEFKLHYYDAAFYFAEQGLHDFTEHVKYILKEIPEKVSQESGNHSMNIKQTYTKAMREKVMWEIYKEFSELLESVKE